jgi:hypothetical protein
MIVILAKMSQLLIKVMIEMALKKDTKVPLTTIQGKLFKTVSRTRIKKQSFNNHQILSRME